MYNMNRNSLLLSNRKDFNTRSINEKYKVRRIKILDTCNDRTRLQIYRQNRLTKKVFNVLYVKENSPTATIDKTTLGG